MEHLIPEVWFVGLSSLMLTLIASAAMFCLMYGADWLVKGASGLAYQLGIPKIIIGATIVSLGTTAPECAVSVMAAWTGNAGLALGNAVGSIIADTGLIFGLGCVLTALPADRFLLARQGWVQFGAAALLAVICYVLYFLHGDQARLEQWVGMLFLGLLVGYMWISLRWSRQRVAEAGLATLEPDEPLAAEDEAITAIAESTRPLWLIVGVLLGLMAAGLAVVILSSHVLIQSVSILALRLDVPQVVISATVVALGTSLPELVVGMTSIRRGHPELLVGNVVGADILNVLFVIGASAIAKPLPIIELGAGVPAVFLYLHLPVMLTILVLFRVFIFASGRREQFSRWMGWPLLIVYLGFVALSFLVNSIPAAG